MEFVPSDRPPTTLPYTMLDASSASTEGRVSRLFFAPDYSGRSTPTNWSRGIRHPKQLRDPVRAPEPDLKDVVDQSVLPSRSEITKSAEPDARRPREGNQPVREKVMSSEHHILHAAEKLVHALNKTVDKNLPREIAEVVKTHSAGAAAAAVAAGWIPAAGGLAATGIAAGFVWTMYGRINSKIGLPLKENVVKSLATGVATNLAASFIAGLAVQTLLSMIPGIGSLAASTLAGATVYALTLASGYVYLKLLTNLFLSGKDPTDMNESSLKEAAKLVAATENIKVVISDAKAGYEPPPK